MPATLSPLMKSGLINLLTGVSSDYDYNRPIYCNFYNGAQPASPEDTPAGSSVWSSIPSSVNISAGMSPPSGGISSLASSLVGVSQAAASGVSGITFARFYSYGYPGPSYKGCIDVPASVSGGGGGVIIDSLTSVAGVGPTLLSYSIKIPLSLGTLAIGSVLASYIAGMFTGLNYTPRYLGSNTSGASTIDIYSGSPPATADEAATGTLLCTITLGATQIWAAAGAGTAVLAVQPSAASLASGTIGYARLKKTIGGYDYVIQGTAGTSGTDFVFNTATTTGTSTTVTLISAPLSI
jgi:hypothetical protein